MISLVENRWAKSTPVKQPESFLKLGTVFVSAIRQLAEAEDNVEDCPQLFVNDQKFQAVGDEIFVSVNNPVASFRLDDFSKT